MSLYKTLVTLLFTTFIGVAGYSQANYNHPDWTIGLTGNASFATSHELQELSHKTTGVGLGMNITFLLAPKHNMRFRYDNIKFGPSTKWFVSGYEIVTDTRVETVELDYMYFITPNVFTQIGMGDMHWTNTYAQIFPPSFGRAQNIYSVDTSNSITTFGVGYQVTFHNPKSILNSTVFELRYISGGQKVIQMSAGFNF